MEHFPPPHPLPGRVSGMHSSCMHGGVWSGGASRKWSGPADVSCHRRLLAQTENPRDGLRKGGGGKERRRISSFSPHIFGFSRRAGGGVRDKRNVTNVG